MGLGHIFVTEYRNNRVYETYMASRSQIAFTRFDYETEGIVGSYFINYVPTGKYPIISESIGLYDESTFEYKETYHYAWYQNEAKNA